MCVNTPHLSLVRFQRTSSCVAYHKVPPVLLVSLFNVLIANISGLLRCRLHAYVKAGIPDLSEPPDAGVRSVDRSGGIYTAQIQN